MQGKKNPIFDTVDLVGFINEHTDPKYMDWTTLKTAVLNREYIKETP